VFFDYGSESLNESLSFLEAGLEKGLSFLPLKKGISVDTIMSFIRMALPTTVIIASIIRIRFSIFFWAVG
jgi:hypothetical protein